MEPIISDYNFWSWQYTSRNLYYWIDVFKIDYSVKKYFNNHENPEECVQNIFSALGKWGFIWSPPPRNFEITQDNKIIEAILSGSPLCCDKERWAFTPSGKGVLSREREDDDSVIRIDLSSNKRFILCAISELKDVYDNHHENRQEYRRIIDEKINQLCMKARVLSDNVGISKMGNMSRAVGLWLWDYILWNECNKAAAIRAFENRYDLEQLGIGNIEQSDLRFFILRTGECIKYAEVLPFSKRKKGGTKK